MYEVQQYVRLMFATLRRKARKPWTYTFKKTKITVLFWTELPEFGIHNAFQLMPIFLPARNSRMKAEWFDFFHVY